MHRRCLFNLVDLVGRHFCLPGPLQLVPQLLLNHLETLKRVRAVRGPAQGQQGTL